LSEDSGQEPHDGPAEEAAVRCGVATVEKWICFLAVAVDVAVNPNLPFVVLSQFFKQGFSVEDLRLEALIRLSPLSI
jgi:hypothetical protein